MVSALLACRVTDRQHSLAKVFACKSFETLVLHGPIHIVVEFGDDGERNKVEHNVDSIISAADDTDVRKLDIQARKVLEQARGKSKARVRKSVCVIH